MNQVEFTWHLGKIFALSLKNEGRVLRAGSNLPTQSRIYFKTPVLHNSRSSHKK